MEKWDLPDGWKWSTLSDVGRVFAGSSAPQGENYFIGGTEPFVRTQDVGRKKRTTELIETTDKINSFAIENLHLIEAPKGTILFPKSGAAILTNNRALLGRNAYIVSHLGAIKTNEFWDEKFVYYWMCIVDMKDYINNIAYPSLTLEVVKTIPIPKPPTLETQKRIVLRLETLLGEVKSARELQESIEEETNLLVDSVLTEIFANRDQWQNEKNLADLVSIEAPLVDPRDPEYSHFPHIYGASIEGGTGRLLDYQSAAEDGMTSNKYLFEPGVVLYSKIRPYLRKVTIADFKGVCSADMYPLTVTSDELLPEFLMWTLLSPEFTEFINAFSLRARIPKVNREQLMAYRMRYPDINSQKKIAAYIQNWRDEVSEMQRAQRENAELLEQTEQSLLAQAFRGEL